MKKIKLFLFICIGLANINFIIAQQCVTLTDPAMISAISNPIIGTCNIPNQIANNDAQIAFTGVLGAVKAEKWEGSVYAGIDFGSSTNTIVSNAINFPNLKHSFTYTFRFWSIDGCSKDITLTTPNKNCSSICSLPISDNTSVLGTCSGAIANNDAAINFTNIANADKVEKWEGYTYNGSNYNTSTSSIGGTSISIGGLKHNTTYTFRFWSGNNSCYTDVIRTTPVNPCLSNNPVACVNIIDGPVCCTKTVCTPVKITRRK